MRISHLAAWAATSFLVMAAGCGGGSDGTTAPPPSGTRASVEGTVMNAATGAGIAGATVRSGTATATTGADGRYTLQVEPGERVVINAQAPGFAEGTSNTAVVENTTATAVTKLLPVASTATIFDAAGGTVTVPGSPAAVILPPGAFGTTGQVTVDLTVVNPAQDPTQMPGGFVTSTGALMESAGAIIVSPRDAAGNRLQLAAGKTATIRIPLSTRGTVEPTIPLFWLNTETGLWVQEGTATLMGTAPNQYYEGTVTHFTAWNADRVYDAINVRGCVQNATGARVAGVSVTSDGIDYSGTATARTDSNGDFVVPMKKSARAAITGVLAGRLTNSVSVAPSAADVPLSTCLVLSETNNSVTIRLTWGAGPEDVDSHLFTPSGAHISYRNQGSLGSEPFASLDVDDTDSFGPEIVTVTRLMVGTYTYGVHNFSETNSPGLTGSPVRVELNIAGRVQVFTLPAGETASTRFARMFTITVAPNCSTTVAAVNAWEADVPADPGPVTPTYCTP